MFFFFFFQAEDGIRDKLVTGVQTCALPILGVTRGDRVAVLLPNRPEWVVAALAIAKIGGIVSAISTFSTARELGWMLEHSEAVALITVSAFRGRAYLDALH